MVETHPSFAKLQQLAKEKGVHHFQYLTEMLENMLTEEKAPFLPYLTRNLFLYPDLHGNVSAVKATVDCAHKCPTALAYC